MVGLMVRGPGRVVELGGVQVVEVTLGCDMMNWSSEW